MRLYTNRPFVFFISITGLHLLNMLDFIFMTGNFINISLVCPRSQRLHKFITTCDELI